MRTFWPFRHAGLKLLSLGLAVLLWLVVSGEETVERGLRVPLELQQFPQDLELDGVPPANVEVRVRGASGALSRLSTGDVVAVLDVHGAQAGRRIFHMTPEHVRVPFGVEVVQVNPASVVLAFERSASRQVPVVPTVEGKPAPGFVLGRMTADPETVEVVGPQSAVKRATEALTEPISVAGAREPVRETVTVGFLDPSLRLRTPRAAVVTVQILPAPAERTVRDLPVRFRNLAPNLAAEAVPAIAAVALRGSRELLSRVEPGDINVDVDLTGLGAGQYTLAARADVAKEAGVMRVDPPTIQVRITRAKN